MDLKLKEVFSNYQQKWDFLQKKQNNQNFEILLEDLTLTLCTKQLLIDAALIIKAKVEQMITEEQMEDLTEASILKSSK